MEYFAYSQKSFVYKYVVMLSDTDQFKHMSFANYLKLMFLATDALFVGFLSTQNLDQYRLKLIDSRMQFKKQTTVGDNILIKINSTCLNNTAFVLLYTFVTEIKAELVGLGRQNYALVDLNGSLPLAAEIGKNLRSLLEPIGVDENNLIYKY